MCRFLMHNSSDGSRADNWCERSKHVAWSALPVRCREASPREQRQGCGGAAQPRNFLEFKRVNYPGIRIKSLQFKLSLYMMYQMNPVTFMWFISTYLVPENNFYFKHSSKYTSWATNFTKKPIFFTPSDTLLRPVITPPPLTPVDPSLHNSKIAFNGF